MTYDFKPKKPANNARRKLAQQRSARKSPHKPTQHKKPLPGWLILLAIILVSSFGYGLYYIKNAPTPSSENTTLEQVVKQATKAAPTAVEKASNSDGNKETRFEFYTLLPEQESVLPPVSERPKIVEAAPNVHYMLQAGAFKQQADAERRRAELILNGYDASLEPTKYKNGQTWYRLLIGPFTSQSKLAKARSDLLQNNIETLVIKRKND